MKTKIVYLWTNGDHITNLSETLEVEGYGCGILDISGKLPQLNANDVYYLCCDFIEDSFVNSTRLPVLREIRVNSKGGIQSDVGHVIWIPVTRTSLSYARLYITDHNGKIISLGGRGLYSTLLFIPNPHHD